MFSVVNPLVFTGIVLGFGFLVYGISKGKIMYADFEARHRKADFASENNEEVDESGAGRGFGLEGFRGSFRGRWNMGFRRTSQYDDDDDEEEGGNGGRMSTNGDVELTSMNDKKDKTEGEAFLESIGLGKFYDNFEMNAIISVEDLCDSSLISDHDLVHVIGMEIEQVSTFRQAVNDRTNQNSHLAVTSLHGAVTSTVADSKDMRQNLLGKPISQALEQQLTAAERKRRAQASKFRDYQKIERKKALDAITTREAQKREELEQKKLRDNEEKQDNRDSALNVLLGGSDVMPVHSKRQEADRDVNV